MIRPNGYIREGPAAGEEIPLAATQSGMGENLGGYL